MIGLTQINKMTNLMKSEHKADAVNTVLNCLFKM